MTEVVIPVLDSVRFISLTDAEINDLVKTVMSAELRNAASPLEVQLGMAVVALQSRIEELKREVETHTISVDEARDTMAQPDRQQKFPKPDVAQQSRSKYPCCHQFFWIICIGMW